MYKLMRISKSSGEEWNAELNWIQEYEIPQNCEPVVASWIDQAIAKCYQIWIGKWKRDRCMKILSKWLDFAWRESNANESKFRVVMNLFWLFPNLGAKKKDEIFMIKKTFLIFF